ncbi:MAG TPA: M28 family metallopeptidase [Candidatus Dormibacteraeota bacterium]|nr:M28 family metallopeptidase [Candidatus Dormibacteraeota bacterium]
MKRMLVLVAGLLTIIGVAAATEKTDWNALGKRWWAHIQFLADDKLEGRNTGSPGYEKAAAYVADQFEKAGLREAGTSGYFQPIDFDVRQIDEAHSGLALVRDGKSEPVTLGTEATIGMRADPAETVDAAAVFVGYGLSIPEKKYDDLAGLDLHGKIAVFLSGGPEAIPGPLKSHHQAAGERWKALQKAGAIGSATIPNPKSMDLPWERSSAARLQPAMDLADTVLQELRGQQISLTINPAHANKLLAGSGHTIEEILAASDNDKPLPRFPLAAKIRARIAVKRSRVTSKNVIGLLPGNDILLRTQYVVLSAHLDHIGVGAPIRGDKIYNGAMDDASGIASLIEIAKGFGESGAKPKRSILFLAVTAEEKGLLGSKYFAANPTVHGNAIVADINMDMFLPLFALKYLEVQGLDESTLGDDIRMMAQEAGVEVQADKEPNVNRFIRSDQYNFIRKGVPSLAFKFGYVPGSPQEKLFKNWVRLNYHAPSDDLSQPVDIAAAAQFDRIVQRLAEHVANSPERPRWKDDSFFKRFAQEGK